jgi:hypothetical protein
MGGTECHSYCVHEHDILLLELYGVGSLHALRTLSAAIQLTLFHRWCINFQLLAFKHAFALSEITFLIHERSVVLKYKQFLFVYFLSVIP